MSTNLKLLSKVFSLCVAKRNVLRGWTRQQRPCQHNLDRRDNPDKCFQNPKFGWQLPARRNCSPSLTAQRPLVLRMLALHLATGIDRRLVCKLSSRPDRNYGEGT